MKLMVNSLLFSIFTWVSIGVISLFKEPRYAFDEWIQAGIVLVVMGFIGGLVLNGFVLFLLAASGSSYQSPRNNEQASQPRIETIFGEVVDDSHLPLYARNPSNAKRLPKPAWKNIWENIPNMGFAGTVGDLEFFHCPQCGHTTPHFWAEKDTYVCKGDDGRSCGNINYIGK